MTKTNKATTADQALEKAAEYENRAFELRGRGSRTRVEALEQKAQALFEEALELDKAA